MINVDASQRLKIANLPLDLLCSGPVTHSGEILTTGKSHGKKSDRMSRNKLLRVMKHYTPTGRRDHGRSIKIILDTWDRNGSTSGPTPWKIYDDDYDDDDYKSEFLQEAQILHWSEELKPTLDSPSGIVQRPVSSVILQNTEDTSSKLALTSDVSLLPYIHENVRSMSVKRRSSHCGATVVVTSSPYENKSAGCMEKKVPKEQKKKRAVTRKRKLA